MGLFDAFSDRCRCFKCLERCFGLAVHLEPETLLGVSTLGCFFWLLFAQFFFRHAHGCHLGKSFSVLVSQQELAAPLAKSPASGKPDTGPNHPALPVHPW